MRDSLLKRFELAAQIAATVAFAIGSTATAFIVYELPGPSAVLGSILGGIVTACVAVAAVCFVFRRMT
jgi:hypothetical protein